MAGQALGADALLHPFTTDRPNHVDGYAWSYFFEIPGGTTMAQDGVFNIDYDTSPTLSGVEGGLTVLFNHQPVNAVPLRIASPDPTHWQVSIPKKYCKKGFNEIDIISRSRTTLGPCREDDDLMNWIRFRTTSSLRLQFTEPALYPLTAYPFPFVDWTKQPVATLPISVTALAKDRTLSAGLNIAAGWGSKMTNDLLSLKMTREPVSGPSVHIGLQQEFGLPLTTFPIESKNHELWVTGKNSDTIDAAVRALNNPNLIAQMTGQTAAPVEYVPKPDDAGPRVGSITLEQLGYPFTRLAGIGSQGAVLVLRRPVAARLGRGGELRLKFRHSAVLMKTRSILSVTINDQQVGSVALTPENANEGEMVCPLPINLADANEWNFAIIAHNELASVDCAKTYQDVAWTTILGSSDFELREGTLPSSPFLEGFPYLRSREGLLPQSAVVNVGSKPSTEVLSFAATTAARSSQTNRGLTNWTASTGEITGDEDVVIGLLRQEDRFRPVLQKLLVAPSKSGDPKIAGNLPILPSALVGGVVIEAIPKSGNGVSYYVLASSNGALQRFTDYLAKPEAAGLLRGQVAVFTKEGELFTFDTLTPEERRNAELAEMRRYKPEMSVYMTIVLGLLAAAGVFIASKFVKRTRPKQ